jgi:hypothetical protein
VEFLTVIKAHFNFYGSFGKWLRHRRDALKTNSKSKNKNAIYNGSIIWQYYAKKQKTFSKLNWKPKPLEKQVVL